MTAAFPAEADLATALGLLSAATTAASFLIAVALANRLYARFGIATVALVLPIVYLVGFGIWLVRFSLATAVGFRFVQQVTQRASRTPSAFDNVVLCRAARPGPGLHARRTRTVRDHDRRSPPAGGGATLLSQTAMPVIGAVAGPRGCLDRGADPPGICGQLIRTLSRRPSENSSRRWTRANGLARDPNVEATPGGPIRVEPRRPPIVSRPAGSAWRR